VVKDTWLFLQQQRGAADVTWVLPVPGREACVRAAHSAAAGEGGGNDRSRWTGLSRGH
jgi:hypothetical protein